MKKWLTGFFIICMCCLSMAPSNVQAKNFTKGNIKKEIAKQKKTCRQLSKQYRAAKSEEKRCKNLYQKEKGKYSAIIFGSVKSRSPFIVYSGYIASPLQGWFLVKGGSAGLGSFIGEVKLTGEYYQWEGHPCRVVQYCKNGTPAYRKYKQATKKRKNIEDKTGKAYDTLTYLKGLPKSKLQLKDQHISVGEKKKMQFKWKRFNNKEKTKWKVSNSKLVTIVKSGSDNVTLKGKKYGTVTLTSVAAVSGKKSKCKIKIYDKVKQLAVTSADGSKAYANGSSIAVGIGKQFRLKTSCLPSTSFQGITYTSANQKIAAVDANGVITGKKIGKTTVKISDELGRITQNITVIVNNSIVGMTPEKSTVSVSLHDKSGDIRGTGIDKGQKSTYWNMQKLNDANPAGMFFLDFSAQMDQANAAVTDILTCTSSNNSVVVPMFVYYTSRGENFPDDSDDYDYLTDPMMSMYFCNYPSNSPEYDPYCPTPGGRLFIGIIGSGNAAITLKSQTTGVTCSWNIQVPSNGQNPQPSVTEEPQPGGTEEELSEDAVKLKEIITQQRTLGAVVKKNLDDDDYSWDDEGRLTGIFWSDNHLQGSIDFSSFTALEYLYCSDNALNSISVAGCTLLQSLSCGSNQLESLDVSGCSALSYLSCENNQLETLNISGCTALELLDCSNNRLSTLDVNDCIELYYIYIDPDVVVTGYPDVEKQEADVTELQKIIAVQKELGAQVSEDLDSDQYIWNREGRLRDIYWDDIGLQGEIDFSIFTDLQVLSCEGNSLTGLDVYGCSALTSLWCNNNQLESLNVSGCSALERLWCRDNQLESLDVSGCFALSLLDCDDTVDVMGRYED